MQNKVLKNDLKLYRQLRGLTQEELASMVGVTRKTINVIEAGNYAPSTYLALTISSAIEIPLEKIFYLAPEINHQ